MSICKKYNCLECPAYKACGGCENCKGMPLKSNKKCVCSILIEELGFPGYINRFNQIINSINSLNIEGLYVNDLNVLPGSYVNLEYTLPNGNKIKFLEDDQTYFANQIEVSDNKCYGVVSNGKFILVATYEKEGRNPELILYKNI